MLIEKCVCGSSNFSSPTIINTIPTLQCQECFIIHQNVNMTSEEYGKFYQSDYHFDFQHKRNTPDYNQRYQHDYDIALERTIKYRDYLKGPILDVGASNGAFVDALYDKGYDCWGIEISESFKNKRVYDDWMMVITHEPSFGTVIMNDVLEHFIDPVLYLGLLESKMRSGAYLIIDFPDFWVLEGRHHWKLIEHLWFFTEHDIIALLKKYGFKFLKLDEPIPGKQVFYFQLEKE